MSCPAVGIADLTHNLAPTAHLVNRVAVMYRGILMELAPSLDVLGTPFHPYATALMSVIPVPNPRARRERLVVAGETPSPAIFPSGCRFHPRCSQVVPDLKEAASGHFVACLLRG